MKIRNVDKISPLRELWDELHDKKPAVYIVLAIDLILSILVSSCICILYHTAAHTITHKVQDLRFTLFNILTKGITSTWYFTIILFIIFATQSFKWYRAVRKKYVKDYGKNYLKSKKETFGGAHFQTIEELDVNCNRYDCVEDTVEDVLGIDEEDKFCCLKDTAGLSPFEMYYGAPGSGKSSAIILGKIYQGIRRGISLIITDTKGDLYRRTSEIAKECGYVVRVLNLKPNELRNSDGFDLFKSLDANAEDFDEKVDVITETIFKNTTDDLHEKQDFWYIQEYNVIKMAIMYICSFEFKEKGQNHLPYIHDFLTQKATWICSKFNSHSRNMKDSVMMKCYAIFANNSSENQSQILAGAAARIRKLANPTLKKVLSADEIDTVLPMTKKCIYYVIIPDQNNPYKFVSSLFFTQMFADLCAYHDSLEEADKRKTLKVSFLLDEYFASGGIVGLPSKISTIRSRGMSLCLILQSNSQLEAMYTEQDAATIKNCTAIKGLLSTNDINLSKEFSEYFGTETVIVENSRYYESSGDIVHAIPMVQNTTGENQRSLMNAEEFMNGKLRRDQICYQISNMPPVILKKYFVELNGKPNHFMEQWSQDLIEKRGDKLPGRHKPRWRYLEEQEAAKANSPTPDNESPSTQPDKPQEPAPAEPGNPDNNADGSSPDANTAPQQVADSSPVNAEVPTLANIDETSLATLLSTIGKKLNLGDIKLNFDNISGNVFTEDGEIIGTVYIDTKTSKPRFTRVKVEQAPAPDVSGNPNEKPEVAESPSITTAEFDNTGSKNTPVDDKFKTLFGDYKDVEDFN